VIIYFADRAMNILGSASTGLPKGLMITNDKKTEEISEGVAIFECNLDYNFVNPDEGEEQEVDVKKLAAVGNFILKQSSDSSEVEVYTIIDSTIDPIQKDASIYAEDAGLDLLNEVVGKYAADKAYNIAYYINKFAYDSGFEIGINEVSNLTRKLSWDGETTATERLLSVATQFDNAEIEFSFKVENMAMTGKYINVYKNRGNDSGVTLTVGKEVSGFRIKSSIADLATAYRCTGGTPEGSENPITLNGYKYDDGDFYVEGSYVKSRKALEKWSRYQIKTEKNKNDVGHIVKSFTYNTTSKSELCNRAVSSLKKICDEAVTYEVELLYLPDGVKVGDTVSIVDDDDNIYLTARLLKLEMSESNDTKEAELGDYVRQGSGIDEKIIELAERFEKIAKNRNFYTWTAFADDENGTGISANAYGKDYLGIATNRLAKEADLSDPTQYTWVKIKGEQGIPGTAGKDGQMLYATCNTAAGTVAKVATLASGTLSLKAGATVAVKFTYANTASSPTLNIAGTGAKAMYIQGARDVYWTDGATVAFTYDGANWRVASEPVYAPTATIGNAAGFNVFIDGTSVQVRKGTEELASFKGDEIRLGEGVDCAKVFICNLEIGVDSEEMYLRNASTRISTKASHESGSASVPSVVVNDTDTYVNGRGMSSLIDLYPRNIHRMSAGTRVVKAGKTGTSRQIFSNSEINSLLGVTDSSNSNTAVFVSNGDGAATSVHFEGVTYLNGAWNAVFNANVGSGPIRVNYLIVYWG
jgi:phage minor structural protein